MTGGNSIALERNRDTALAKCFCFNVRDTKYPCVYRRTKLPERGVNSEKVRETGRRCVRINNDDNIKIIVIVYEDKTAPLIAFIF